MILIDIECTEYSTLQGAFLTLKHVPKPVCTVEVGSHQHPPAGLALNPRLLDTFDLLCNTDYAAYTVVETLRRIERNEIKAIAEGGPDTLHLPNFIFVDKARQADIIFSSAHKSHHVTTTKTQILA